ncbi:hypothetical protein ACPXAO_24510, partial [Salmonella enterica]|uniref:hypothetical protein n=1 Tax=Salmonella enterica TaxID=28901 RepID=UPI003CEE0CC7
IERQTEFYERWARRGKALRAHVAVDHRQVFDDWVADEAAFRLEIESHIQIVLKLCKREPTTD